MTRPTITVEIAFQSSTLTATPVWFDVSSYAIGFGYQRGRQRDLNRMETGTGYVILNNQDNRFDPSNVDAAYYFSGTWLRIMKQIRIRATWAAVTYDLARGFIRTWDNQWNGDGNGARMRLEFNDALFYFASRKATNAARTIAAGLSGAQITEMLDDLLWPAGDRAIDAGSVSCQAQTYPDGENNVLPILQMIADTENGALFVDGAGRVVFHQRSYRQLTAANAATFGTGGLTYSRAPLVYDDIDIKNDIRLTRVGGAQQTAFDAGSDTDYFRRDLQKSGYLHTTDAEVLALANFLLAKYKQPVIRVASVETDGDADDALWPYILDLELDDRIRVIRPSPLTLRSEVQTVSIFGSPTGGTFALLFLGQVTTALAYNISAAALQTALEALSTIGSGNIAVVLTAPGSYRLTFQGALANTGVPQITKTAVALTGGSSPGVNTGTSTQAPWAFTGDSFVDGIDVRVNERAWTVRYKLVPVELSSAWILEDPTYGVLESTTILGY